MGEHAEFLAAPSISSRDGEPLRCDRITPLRHEFDRHPLMAMPALAALAHRLRPTRQCRFIRPGSTVASEFWHDDDDPQRRSLDRVFERIEDPGSWIALYDVQTDPIYRGFLDEVIECVRPQVERSQPGIFRVAGFVFISAPPSVTPFHIDRENNLWLQIHGRKSLHVWDHRDRDVVSGEAVERFIVHRSLDDVKLSDASRERAQVFDVGPGDGVYWPATTPHMTTTQIDWVRPGAGVSVSIGVCFYTSATRHDARVHQFNHVLRRLGAAPRGPGEVGWLDALKAPVGRIAAWAQAALRGYDPPPGSY